MEHFFGVDGPTRARLLSIFDTVKRLPDWPRVQGSCFCMAGFLALVFESLGRRAEVRACYAAINADGAWYGLGVRGLTTGSNEVEGHVVCVVDGRWIVDFGTTNIRRHFLPTFPMAMAAPAAGPALFPAAAELGDGRSIAWYDDAANERTQAALAGHQVFSRSLFAQYQQARTRNRGMRRAARHHAQAA